jgi:ElaB/YqjD/DUF883 family membrane-anchored ribosome-binding protein
MAKKATGVMDKLGDVVGEGVKSVTGKVDDVLDKVNKQIGTIEESCNKSLRSFDDAADVNGTMAENITKFQGLVNGTIGKYLKLYASFSDKLTGTFDSASSTLKLAGQGDLADDLNASISSAMDKLASLSEAGQEVMSKAAETSEEKASEEIPKVKSAIQASVGTANDFAVALIDSFRKVSDQLLELMESKVPKEAQDAVRKPLAEMIKKAQVTAEKLKKALTMTSDGLDRSADTVSQSLGSPGFFGKIKDFFGNLFR